jgi:uncharacterized protein (UPF0254 family)
MTDTPDTKTDDDMPASEGLREAKARAAAKKRTQAAVAVGVAAGIGSAALAAAFLYANRGKKKDGA